jgi:hypothetical protein
MERDKLMPFSSDTASTVEKLLCILDQHGHRYSGLLMKIKAQWWCA